ncbi:MAG: hypothetical protein WCR42_13860 [bacterium]
MKIIFAFILVIFVSAQAYALNLYCTYNYSIFLNSTIPYKNHWIRLYPAMVDVQIINGKETFIILEKKDTSELNLENGKLISQDAGEWGGSLTYRPFKKNHKSIKIKEGNVKKVFTFNNEIYFIESLCHMGIEEGALYKLFVHRNSFYYIKIVSFENAPAAFALKNHTILIACDFNCYFIQNIKDKDFILYKLPLWFQNIHPYV